MAQNEYREIQLEQVEISGQNTRKDLNQGTEDASLQDLAKSIDELGLLNPITVRQRPLGGYEVIAGQRRTLAFRLLGRRTIPAYVRTDTADTEVVALSLVENMQRADMAPLDKAKGLAVLTEQYGSAAEVAKRTGLSVPTIRRYTTLLRLPASVADDFTVASGTASIAVAESIAKGFETQEEMEEVWGKVKGFTADVAKQVISASGGDLDRIDENVDRAIAGEFNRQQCGSSLATRPFVPKSKHAEILRIAQDKA